MPLQKKVELLSLGDELLAGIRVNTHLTYLGEMLARNGLDLLRNQELPDDLEAIRSGFLGAWERADLVITTGGLGPTSDDLTMDALALALGRGMRMDAAVEEAIRERFARRGWSTPENNLRQCRILEGATVLPNPEGTAPGQWLEADGRILVVLPGPTHEMQPMFENEVLSRLREKGWATGARLCTQLRTSGAGESQIAQDLAPILAPFDRKVRVAYCAHNGLVDVRLTATGDETTEDDMKSLAHACCERLGDSFAGYGDCPMAAIILRQLRNLNRTLSVAESCTGGLLAARFTDVAGASKVFVGGLVCYRNDIKENLLGVPGCILEQHGAVSAECAVAMATASAEVFETDYALSITGYAGPEGGREPAGTVYVGLHSPVGVWSQKVFHAGSRGAVRERAVNVALDFLRRKLRQYEVHDFLDSCCQG
ncbi:MAG: CinA family nicotinamide mononucleotide deamidase-related protein [Opitutales bacterium]|nr:CinA family nicotinamide mononucleotide deamidase-related protein [Opitutales bacterium]